MRYHDMSHTCFQQGFLCKICMLNGLNAMFQTSVRRFSSVMRTQKQPSALVPRSSLGSIGGTLRALETFDDLHRLHRLHKPPISRHDRAKPPQCMSSVHL
eukprot:TRINITY_DN12475_c0_g2_i2.p1 TRINITY_DN12475_c0_g2~~TRINITY_DN12475_c0_g2_i2.p1  ORF type:complete len:100 (-),score=4.07 TRINITY_DN12475_c0_g2_i2:119-418(-)